MPTGNSRNERFLSQESELNDAVENVRRGVLSQPICWDWLVPKPSSSNSATALGSGGQQYLLMQLAVESWNRNSAKHAARALA